MWERHKTQITVQYSTALIFLCSKNDKHSRGKFIKKFITEVPETTFGKNSFCTCECVHTSQIPNTSLPENPDNSRNMLDTIDVRMAYFIAHFAITYDSGGNLHEQLP